MAGAGGSTRKRSAGQARRSKIVFTRAASKTGGAAKKQIPMCSLQPWTCSQVQVLPRQWMVGPSSDSRLRRGSPGLGKLCRKRAGLSVAQAIGGDGPTAPANMRALCPNPQSVRLADVCERRRACDLSSVANFPVHVDLFELASQGVAESGRVGIVEVQKEVNGLAGSWPDPGFFRCRRDYTEYTKSVDTKALREYVSSVTGTRVQPHPVALAKELCMGDPRP